MFALLLATLFAATSADGKDGDSAQGQSVVNTSSANAKDGDITQGQSVVNNDTNGSSSNEINLYVLAIALSANK